MSEFEKYARKHCGISSLKLHDFQSVSAAYVSPTIIEERQLNVATMDVFSRLMMDRIIFLGAPIYDDAANIIQAQLLFLESVDPDKDVQIYINSPGGSVSAGLGIYDTMQLVSCDVGTICTGLAASMGAVLLTAGAAGKRAARACQNLLFARPGAARSIGSGGRDQRTPLPQPAGGRRLSEQPAVRHWGSNRFPAGTDVSASAAGGRAAHPRHCPAYGAERAAVIPPAKKSPCASASGSRGRAVTDKPSPAFASANEITRIEYRFSENGGRSDRRVESRRSAPPAFPAAGVFAVLKPNPSGFKTKPQRFEKQTRNK